MNCSDELLILLIALLGSKREKKMVSHFFSRLYVNLKKQQRQNILYMQRLNSRKVLIVNIKYQEVPKSYWLLFCLLDYFWGSKVSETETYNILVIKMGVSLTWVVKWKIHRFHSEWNKSLAEDLKVVIMRLKLKGNSSFLSGNIYQREGMFSNYCQ